MWISANNTCMAISQWPSFVVTPDGVVVQQAVHETPDIILTDVDTNLNFHDGALDTPPLRFNGYARLQMQLERCIERVRMGLLGVEDGRSHLSSLSHATTTGRARSHHLPASLDHV